LNQIVQNPEDIFAEVPTREEKTWGQWFQGWKDFGINVTMGGVKVSASVLNTLSNLTSRKEMATYLGKLDKEGAKKLPKDVYKAWLELNNKENNNLSQLTEIEELKRVYKENPAIAQFASIKDIISQWEAEGSPDAQEWMLDMFDKYININPDSIR
jgi:histidyl-tRNA synthetase